MKKVLALLLVFVMLFSIVGCGKEEPDDNSTTTTTEAVNNDVESSTSETTTKQTQKPTETTTKKSSDETTTKKTDSTPVTIKKKDFGNGQIVFYPSNIQETNTTYPIIAFADGTAQLKSVDFLIAQNKDSDSIFYNKINVNKIGLAGHSQGGRSAVNAAAADSRIDCVVSFAGSNYVEEAEKLSTPAFFIGGSADMIVLAKQWVVPAYENCKGPAVYACKTNAVHTRCCTNPTEYSGYAVAWFDAWLKNDANALKKFKDGGKLSQDSAWQDFACKGI